jgi:hypothetical protein
MSGKENIVLIGNICRPFMKLGEVFLKPQLRSIWQINKQTCLLRPSQTVTTITLLHLS